MGRSQVAAVKQVEIDIGLVFPYIDDALCYLTAAELCPAEYSEEIIMGGYIK